MWDRPEETCNPIPGTRMTIVMTEEQNRPNRGCLEKFVVFSAALSLVCRRNLKTQLLSTLIRHKNGYFQNRSPNRSDLKSPAYNFCVDGNVLKTKVFINDLTNWRQVSCVCAVIDHKFRHNMDPRADSRVDPQITLTMLWRNLLSRTGQTHCKLTSICFLR